MANRGRRRPTRPLLLVLVVASLTVQGCSLFGGGLKFGGHGHLDVRVADELNDDSPVALDLVVVYDSSLEKELLALPATEWFAKRAQYRRDLPRNAFEVWSWEWIPGQLVNTQRFHYRVGALSTLFFASYSTPGEHRERVGPERRITVRLEKSDFVVQSNKR